MKTDQTYFAEPQHSHDPWGSEPRKWHRGNLVQAGQYGKGFSLNQLAFYLKNHGHSEYSQCEYAGSNHVRAIRLGGMEYRMLKGLVYERAL